MSNTNFYRRKVIIQILVPTIVSIILLYFGYLLSIKHVKGLLLEERKNQVKEMVNSIYNMVEEYYKQVEQGQLSKDEAQSILILNIENLRYGKDSKDYYWLYNFDNKMLAHPYFNDTILLRVSNPEFWTALTDMVALAKEKGEGFHEYKWQWKDDTTRIENKISFVKGFEPWQWVMGTGFYSRDVDLEIKELTKNIMLKITALIIVICVLFFIILRRTFTNLKLFIDQEDELTKSIQLFRGMLTHSGLLIHKNNSVIYANEKFSEIFEESFNDTKEFKLSEFVVADEIERMNPFLNQISIKKNGGEMSFWIQTKNNSRKFINVKVAFKHLKNTVFTYFLITDHTEVKEIENQIKILSQTVEQSPDTMVITDLKGNIVYVNRKFCEETGYTYEEAIGNNPNILKSGKMSPEIYDDMWKTISEGKVWQNDLINKKKNGELFWEDTLVFPIKDEKGEIIFYSAIKSNLTKQRQLEKELRESREEAQRNEKIKTAFLNNVSHEVNTPLNAIYGFADVLRSNFDKNDIAYSQATYIYKHTKILIKLFNDIMNYSAFESGNIEIKKEEITISNMLEKLASKYSVKIISEYQKNVEILVDVKDDFRNAKLNSDKEWISKIFDELITNSIKFTIEGTITIGYEIDYEQITFFVKDTGVGIPDNEKGLIKNTFTHGDNLYIGLHKGTGLGLNIIESLIKHLGGEVWFDSIEGKGTSFYFSFSSIDVKDYVFDNKLVDHFPFTGMLVSKNIIIAEDNDNSFEYLNSLLKKEAKEISRVKSETELLDTLKQENKIYNLILFDVYIPKLNNLNNLLSIKSLYPEIPIIALVSAKDEITDELSKKFDAVIYKTISKNKLYKVLKDVIN